MISKNAIELSIKGGWTAQGIVTNNKKLNSESTKHLFEFLGREFIWQRIALDPIFWQALGKSLKWEGSHVDALGRDQWRVMAHRFCDLIYQGKEVDEFWRELGIL